MCSPEPPAHTPELEGAPIGRSISARVIGEVVGIYVAARLLGLVFLLVVERQLHGQRFPGGFAFRLWQNVFDRWDAGFYRMVATDGYPSVLPTNAQGGLLANTWAFFPAFPLTADALNRATGLGFYGAAIVLNLVAGAVAAVCLAAIVHRVAGERAAVRAVALWSLFPTAFVLQVPYAEAVYSALAMGFLLALVERRHGLAAVLLVAASLSRGYAIPLSAAAFSVVIVELVGLRRRGRGDPAASAPRSLPGRVMLIVAASIAPFLWVGIAALVTGRPDAYTATQQVWGFSFDPAVSFERWMAAIGLFGRDPYFTAVVLTLGGAVAAAIAVFGLRLPMELRVYTVFAVLFLLAISQPEAIAFTSIPRFAFGILTLPIVLALMLRHTMAFALASVAFAGLQYLWILNIWSGRHGVAP